jgi:hypothetical protein
MLVSRSSLRRFTSRARFALLVGLLALGICCIPERFAGLTGGPLPQEAGPEAAPPLVEDQTVAPPRPLSPLSVSVVNGQRPRFRWELPQGTTGARLEVCKARACDTAERKSADVIGKEGSLAEDLPPGVWFWRLFGTTARTFGTRASVTWEVVVRAKPPGVTKDLLAPSRSIVDIDGDGNPDFLTMADFDIGAPDGGDPAIISFRGRPDGTFVVDDFAPFFIPATTNLAVTDVDGDGLSDLIFSSDVGNGTQILALRGSPNGLATSTLDPITTPPVTGTPGVAELGDVDGDGYGDVAVSTNASLFLAYGTARGLGAISFFFDNGPFADGGFPEGGPVLLDTPIAVVGAVAHDDAPLSDFAVADPFAGPYLLLLGHPTRFFEALGFDARPDTLPQRIVRLVAGDFDGDGVSDIAFVGVLPSGKQAACVSLAADLVGPEQKLVCWEPPSPPATFGEALIACDLEGDGKDELIVGASDGVDILRLADGLQAEHLATPYAARLTTVHPGGPSPGIWVGVAADGSGLGVFKGKAVSSDVRPPDGTRRFRPTLR